jgi:hypothetical protein
LIGSARRIGYVKQIVVAVDDNKTPPGLRIRMTSPAAVSGSLIC